MSRTTWAPAGAADLVAATGNDEAFDDRFPTQPIAVGRSQVGLTGNLDSTTSADVLNHLRRSARELGQTVVMVTHDQDAAAVTDRVVELADGRIVDDRRVQRAAA